MFYFFGSIVAWQDFGSISQIENFANSILLNKFFFKYDQFDFVE